MAVARAAPAVPSRARNAAATLPIARIRYRRSGRAPSSRRERSPASSRERRHDALCFPPRLLPLGPDSRGGMARAPARRGFPALVVGARHVRGAAEGGIMTCEISLNDGLVTLVSDEDYETLRRHKWRALRPNSRAGRYVIRRLSRAEGRKAVYMHRQILCAPAGMEVDHINHDPLDNRRENLRLATRSQQCQNMRSPKRKGISLGLRGIYRRPNGTWGSQLRSGKARYLGPARTNPIQAAIDYDKMASEIFGEFAVLNFPCRADKSVTAPLDRQRQLRNRHHIGGPECL